MHARTHSPCNSRTCHGTAGGWGDRLRGITTTFYIALLTDSHFDIELTKPVDLSTIYPRIHDRRPTRRHNKSDHKVFIDNPMQILATDDLRETFVQADTMHFVRCNSFRWPLLRINPHLNSTLSYYSLNAATT